MILLIDNYDSFTYNVCQGIGELYENIEVVRNDEITVEELGQREIEALIISPGPGYPESAGISKEAVRYFVGKVPVLGIVWDTRPSVRYSGLDGSCQNSDARKNRVRFRLTAVFLCFRDCRK